jgi:hypothetical protein
VTAPGLASRQDAPRRARSFGFASALGPALAALAATLAGCGSGHGAPADAPEDPDAPAPDATPDAAPACPKVLFNGDIVTTVESQGWSVVMQAPASLTYGTGHVRLETSTAVGATSGGQLLLHRPGALPPPPFRFRVELLVERVSAHNASDSAAAILGSFTPPFGGLNERSQMIYLDAGKLGWADDTQSFTKPIADNAYHMVELAVAADGAAQVTFDDAAQVLVRAGFVSNGTIAIGDQTNDASLDSAIQIRKVELLCP